MKKITGLLGMLFLTSCYYDPSTGCTQHFNYIDCPSANVYSKGTREEKTADINDCLKKYYNTREIYKCMEEKGYERM